MMVKNICDNNACIHIENSKYCNKRKSHRSRKNILPLLVMMELVQLLVFAVPFIVIDPLKLFVLVPPLTLKKAGLPPPLGFAWANIKQRNMMKILDIFFKYFCKSQIRIC